MSDQRGKVLSFGAFELSIGNRLLTNDAKVAPLGARAMDLLIVLGAGKPGRRQENPDRARLAKERSRTSQPAGPHLSATESSRYKRAYRRGKPGEGWRNHRAGESLTRSSFL
jgi:hypothetical protein